MSAQLNRRAILAGTAAAIATPAAALPLHEPDPIFAAIEAYRTTDAAFFARAVFEDELAPASDDDSRTPEMVALVDADIAARRALAETVPTTLAGLLAVLRFAREQSTEYQFLFDGDEETTRFIASLEQGALAMMAAT